MATHLFIDSLVLYLPSLLHFPSFVFSWSLKSLFPLQGCLPGIFLLSHLHCLFPHSSYCHPLPGLTQWLPNGLPGSRLVSSSLSPDIFTLQLKQASFLKYKSCNIMSLLKIFSDSPLPSLKIKFFMWYSRLFITGHRAPLPPHL